MEKKKVKAPVIAKTICIYEVKPACDDGDGDDDSAVKIATPAEMEAAIRSIVVDGLVWSETFNIVEIGFGVKKLLVQFVCEDEKVSLDDIEERMLAFEDIIQSVDQMSMCVRAGRRRGLRSVARVRRAACRSLCA